MWMDTLMKINVSEKRFCFLFKNIYWVCVIIKNIYIWVCVIIKNGHIWPIGSIKKEIVRWKAKTFFFVFPSFVAVFYFPSFVVVFCFFVVFCFYLSFFLLFISYFIGAFFRIIDIFVENKEHVFYCLVFSLQTFLLENIKFSMLGDNTTLNRWPWHLKIIGRVIYTTQRKDFIFITIYKCLGREVASNSGRSHDNFYT